MNRLSRGAVALLVLFTLLLSLPVAGAHAQDDSLRVRAEGFDAIIGNNEMHARDKALDQALRAAVEQAAGVVVDSETLVENFQMVSDRIYSKSRAFVQSYKIISEGAQGDGTYKVVVDAVVAKSFLEAQLKDLVQTGLQQSNKPRTLFMIAEQQIGQEVWTAWWTGAGAQVSATAQSFDLNTTENTFLQEFTDNNFPVVDLAAASGNIKVSNAYGATDLTDRQVQELGNQMAAEMVVYGKAYVRQGNRILNSPMFSIPANISIKVVKTDTGRVVTSASESCTHVHSIPEVGGPEALRKCVKKVAAEIMPKMIEKVVQNHSVELNISYGTYKHLAQFKQALKRELRGIEAIHQRKTAKGSTTLELDMKTGTAQTLADELALRDFPDFLIEIQEVTQNTISIVLVKQ
ncbi:MAG: hypothetical protein KDH09_03635 [Chrysiogenetes bacterium]|nr:hypothetical protein [Chrysiogenetes bacterium]